MNSNKAYQYLLEVYNDLRSWDSIEELENKFPIAFEVARKKLQHDLKKGYPMANYGNRNYSKYNNYNQKNFNAPRKHSGAKKTTYFNKAGAEKHLTTGWKLNRNKELISVKCITTKKTRLTDKGWFGSVACTFTNTVTGEQHFHWGVMHKATGKVVIDSVQMVLNPRAKNGGYCGSYLGK